MYSITQKLSKSPFYGMVILMLAFLAGCGGKGNQNFLSSSDPRRIEILVLGHESEHHNSEKLMMYLETPLFQKGINLTYTTDVADLNSTKLNNYDGLMIYANHDEISAEQESALKSYVESGKALIPIHSASFCFRNSDWFVEAVGGQFSTHGTGDFTATIVNAEHPVMQGISEFETWDETYVHSQVNPDMTVLMERVDDKGKEPYTWVREQGKGRVFYTAYGHNEKTWEKKEFQELVANGILWAVGDDVNELLAEYNIPQPQFEDADIPNYERRDPAPRYQLPMSPEESMKLVQVPVGFELELFASEPMIINPIAFAWDERGRLFVIETTDYPNEVRKEGGDDKIKILEDTNGDGKADKVTVFAEGLNIPTSIMAVNGGMLISMAPDFVFLKDTDGDDVADVKEVVMTGWGKFDTHAGPSNLKYGFDNKVWGVLGYSGFNGEVSGKQFNFSQGVYRFTPTWENMEFLGRTSNNTWGLGFSEDFETFISTANGQHSVYLAMESKYAKRTIYKGTPNTATGIDSHYDMPHITPFLRQVDWHGSYTAAAGHNLYTARNFPQEYWNQMAFVAEPTGRVLHNAKILEEGSGYREKNAFNILASSDEWFSPVHAEVGPDGSLWVADWYNFIIQHNPTPRGFENGEGNAYINPLRDSKHGRIYRLTYKGNESSEVFDLKDADANELLSAIKSDNMFWRLTAQRLIVETQNMDVLDGLYEIINNQEVDEVGLNAPAINALWALHGLGVLDGNNAAAQQAVEKALTHPSAGVRKNAVRVIPKNQAALDAILAANLMEDANLQVRKNAIVAVSEMPASADVSNKLLAISENADNAKDEYLPQAIFAAALTHPAAFEGREVAPKSEADSAMGIADRISRSLVTESYTLSQRNALLFPPDLSGKEMAIEMEVAPGREALDGVMVAQGNGTNGYSLYVYKDALHFAVAQDGDVKIISSRKNLPSERFLVNATLKEDGSMSLMIDGNEVAKGKTKGLFTAPLSPENVRVGQFDSGNKVGDYEGNWRFSGRIGNDSSLELKKVSSSQTGGAVSAVEQPIEVVKDGLITLTAIPHEMSFDKSAFIVSAGSKLVLDFDNPDFVQHNLVIGAIGSLEKIGQAADKMAQDLTGMDNSFVPEMSEVLASTALVFPNSTESIIMTVPSQKGDYPFVCTLPNHWKQMNGVMKVI
ncbi:putative membrane-bound dehydrogenase domain-containing protein [Algoriphagus locisalis]|uniref:Putative membrane-bound dehydrogenase domain-containing protein n=1 Tax=Algoriphagus locisalis TaxID=305507 RepID=A0A1I7DQF6_9BACT|nr:PVC-type heme-binding CxxCH protein [Algoriphagus locisalis]SFU13866.1 putative membrane-bound dehydrogenase domain-containing protein [Algoriphagus locisalis]